MALEEQVRSMNLPIHIPIHLQTVVVGSRPDLRYSV